MNVIQILTRTGLVLAQVECTKGYYSKVFKKINKIVASHNEYQVRFQNLFPDQYLYQNTLVYMGNTSTTNGEIGPGTTELVYELCQRINENVYDHQASVYNMINGHINMEFACYSGDFSGTGEALGNQKINLVKDLIVK